MLICLSKHPGCMVGRCALSLESSSIPPSGEMGQKQGGRIAHDFRCSKAHDTDCMLFAEDPAMLHPSFLWYTLPSDNGESFPPFRQRMVCAIVDMEYLLRKAPASEGGARCKHIVINGGGQKEGSTWIGVNPKKIPNLHGSACALALPVKIEWRTAKVIAPLTTSYGLLL